MLEGTVIALHTVRCLHGYMLAFPCRSTIMSLHTIMCYMSMYLHCHLLESLIRSLMGYVLHGIFVVVAFIVAASWAGGQAGSPRTAGQAGSMV